MKVILTTITMKLEGRWCIDTYARIGENLNNKTFIRRFMMEYAGNGIEELNILENNEIEYTLYTVHDYSTAFNNLEDRLHEIGANTTILNY